MKTNETYFVIAISKNIHFDDLECDNYSNFEDAKEKAESAEKSDFNGMDYNKVVVRSSDSDNDLYTKELNHEKRQLHTT